MEADFIEIHKKLNKENQLFIQNLFLPKYNVQFDWKYYFKVVYQNEVILAASFIENNILKVDIMNDEEGEHNYFKKVDIMDDNKKDKQNYFKLRDILILLEMSMSLFVNKICIEDTYDDAILQIIKNGQSNLNRLDYKSDVFSEEISNNLKKIQLPFESFLEELYTNATDAEEQISKIKLLSQNQFYKGKTLQQIYKYSLIQQSDISIFKQLKKYIIKKEFFEYNPYVCKNIDSKFTSKLGRKLRQMKYFFSNLYHNTKKKISSRFRLSGGKNKKKIKKNKTRRKINRK
jgi:hypothetical protein